MVYMLVYIILLFIIPPPAHAELDRNGVSITDLDKVPEQGDTVYRYTHVFLYGLRITLKFKGGQITINQRDLSAVKQCGIIVDKIADKCVRYYMTPWDRHDSRNEEKEI